MRNEANKIFFSKNKWKYAKQDEFRFILLQNENWKKVKWDTLPLI
jgi:hypothetical protein